MPYFLAIFCGTFVLEDVALASALGLFADGKMALAPAFTACFLGISLGDLGLYGVGFAVQRLNLTRFFKSLAKYPVDQKARSRDFMDYPVILSRFVPGTRLPTYLAAGFLKYSFWRFAFLTLASVFAWVTFAFAAGYSLQPLFWHHWVLGVLGILFFLSVSKSIIPKLFNKWDRRALKYSWRQWLSFEFWPGTLFYLPLIPVYAFLSLKYRGLMTPFYANPGIKNGGIIGESKWAFLKHVPATSPHRLKTVLLPAGTAPDLAREVLRGTGIDYPFILKPDVGQRGFGVRIIRSDENFRDYLALADFDVIAQEFCGWRGEAGLLVVKDPRTSRKNVFSVTDKVFPSVMGDGQTRLGDLILADRRARIIAAVYFGRHREFLDHVPPLGETVLLSECGNHCQGAIFHNGKHLLTPELQAALFDLAEAIPDFYFGRFDVRYQDVDSFKRGNNFAIVEINGAGSEATHIWDADTRLREAYATLFEQWNLLFAIGAAIKQSRGPNVNVSRVSFLKESYRVFFRRQPLSVSS